MNEFIIIAVRLISHNVTISGLVQLSIVTSYIVAELQRKKNQLKDFFFGEI